MSKVPAQERPENQHPDVAFYVTEAGWKTHDVYGMPLVPERGALPVVDVPTLRQAPVVEAKPKAKKPKTAKPEAAVAEPVEEPTDEVTEAEDSE